MSLIVEEKKNTAKRLGKLYVCLYHVIEFIC